MTNAASPLNANINLLSVSMDEDRSSKWPDQFDPVYDNGVDWKQSSFHCHHLFNPIAIKTMNGRSDNESV